MCAVMCDVCGVIVVMCVHMYHVLHAGQLFSSLERVHR